MPSERGPGRLLCVVNFPANTGYGWDFIESLYAGVADHLADRGVETQVAYPSLPAPPGTLRGSAARAVELDATLESPASVRATAAWARRESVRVLYLADRRAVHWAYPLLRLAGVERIVVHDHTSGAKTPPTGLKRAAKWALARTPGLSADLVLAVSEFVARRDLEVSCLRPDRVRTLLNSVPFPPPPAPRGAELRAELGLDPSRPLVLCAARATPEKGVATLLRAFDRALAQGAPLATLLYVGDGPQRTELEALRAGLAAADEIVLAGYRGDVPELLALADFAVVPSEWQEAFGLTVAEPMARGKPVIGTRVGGIPELIDDGVTGLLVPPGDVAALADAIRALLEAPERVAQMGAAARRRVAERFTRERQLRELGSLFESLFEPRLPQAPAPPPLAPRPPAPGSGESPG